VLDELARLKENFNQAKRKQEELENEYKTCLLRKDRAQELIAGLASEKDNWTINAQKSQDESQTVVGDCILSAGIIAYLGAFPVAYREEATSNWKRLLRENRIAFNAQYRLQEVLCDPITIGQWTNNFRLPNDSFSIDNAIIMKNSERFPLFIDP
jgi:dynein heavy chain